MVIISNDNILRLLWSLTESSKGYQSETPFSESANSSYQIATFWPVPFSGFTCSNQTGTYSWCRWKMLRPKEEKKKPWFHE